MVHVIHKLSIEDNERRKPKTKTKQKLIHNVYKHSCKRGLFSQKELKNLQAKKLVAKIQNTEYGTIFHSLSVALFSLSSVLMCKHIRCFGCYSFGVRFLILGLN